MILSRLHFARQTSNGEKPPDSLFKRKTKKTNKSTKEPQKALIDAIAELKEAFNEFNTFAIDQGATGLGLNLMMLWQFHCSLFVFSENFSHKVIEF